jgi:hypothetical protein
MAVATKKWRCHGKQTTNTPDIVAKTAKKRKQCDFRAKRRTTATLVVVLVVIIAVKIVP